MARVAPRNDDGGIVVGWLLKLFLVFALVGIVLYDTVAITYGKVAAADDARTIARSASDAMVVRNADDDKAIKVARNRAASQGITLEDDAITVAKDGSVTVHIQRDISTIAVYRIGPIADLSVADESYTTPALK